MTPEEMFGIFIIGIALAFIIPEVYFMRKNQERADSCPPPPDPDTLWCGTVLLGMNADLVENIRGIRDDWIYGRVDSTIAMTQIHILIHRSEGNLE